MNCALETRKTLALLVASTLLISLVWMLILQVSGGNELEQTMPMASSVSLVV